MRPRDKAPQFPIAPVLEALGFDNVPHVDGHRYRPVRCAFHGDRNASASVSEHGFRCHACGRTGDAISLLREEEGLTYEGALARAAELTGVTDQGVRDPGWGSRSLLD